MMTLRVLFVSTWPEVTDGISTFCENLAFNLPKDFGGYKVVWEIARIKRFKQIRTLYRSKIAFDLKFDRRRDYIMASSRINKSKYDLVVIQFINSIYGGAGGSYVFDLIDNLKVPCALILHSVAMHRVQKDKPLKQRILKGFGSRNLPVVCMSKVAQRFLVDNISMRPKNVKRIYHGAPIFPRLNKGQIDSERAKLGFKKDDFIIYTYGVLREDKGVLEVIKSIKHLLKIDSSIKLLITGEDPNPNKLFAQKLRDVIRSEKQSDNIKYIDKFIAQGQIGKYLQMSDLFITAQKNLGLHSSGTLSYALSAGSAILSTNTYHAQELLGNKENIIEPTTRSIVAHVAKIVRNPTCVGHQRRENYDIGQKIIWPSTAKEYAKYFIEIIKDKHE